MVNKKARVLIVDDHPVVRQGIAYMINQSPDIEAAFQAETPGEALDIVRQKHVDIILLDITLKKGSGLDLIADFRKWRPNIPVLVLSMHDEHLYARRALLNGANGYIMKESPAAEVLNAIRCVLGGGTYLSELIKAEIVASAVTKPEGQPADPVKSLTNRELEIFRLIGLAYSTEKIAETLGISAKTVEVHRLHIKAKLGTQTISELVRYAVQWVEKNI
jgi:DNA-binding NarL/FixJ family response regulator